MIRFDYEAQSLDGAPSSGAVDALDLDDAAERLRHMGLRVTAIRPQHQRGGSIDGQHLETFNAQLAQATASGMPMEQAVRLIADEMPLGRARRTVASLATELERGASLPDAIRNLGRRFPAAYVQAIETGMASNKLGETLARIGRHQQAMDRLRHRTLRAIAYPASVLIGLAVVTIYIGWFVLPGMIMVGRGLSMEKPTFNFRTWTQTVPEPFVTPLLTELVIAVARALPAVLIVLVLAIIVVPVIIRWRRRRGATSVLFDELAMRLPVIGRALRLGVIAQWADLFAMHINAGSDLPRALRCAGSGTASARARSDSDRLAEAAESGKPIAAAGALSILPTMVTRAVELSAARGNLPVVAERLAESAHQQADTAADRVPAVLMPLMLIVVVLGMGLVIAAVLLPLHRAITAAIGMML